MQFVLNIYVSFMKKRVFERPPDLKNKSDLFIYLVELARMTIKHHT